MYSKRIVISVIVISCLVQFITCAITNSNNQIKPSRKAAQRNSNNSEGKQPTNFATAKPRGLTPNNNAKPKVNDNAKSQIKPAGNPMKPIAADKKKENPENPADNPEDNKQKEKPTNRIKRTIRRINNMRKKLCPFRFLRRAYEKIKPKPMEDEQPPETLIKNNT